MAFEEDKKNILGKKDKSSKGSIDTRIKCLCDSINRQKDFYTTSSCAGRIMLIKLAEDGKKDKAEWLYVTHETADAADLLTALGQPPKEEVWFRFEPMILHIACSDAGSASKMLALLHDCGLKRAGIISMSGKIMIEAIGNETISAPFAKDRKRLASDEYIAELVEMANSKMENNWANIEKITNNLKEKKKF